MSARRLGPAVALLCAGLARDAAAEPARSELDKAEKLFDQGREAMAKGDWATACPLFEASATLKEMPAVLTKVARCEAHHERFAKAVATYDRALLAGPGAELGPVVVAEREEARGRAPRLRVVVSAPLVGVTITVNGAPITETTLREGLLVDVGQLQHVVASAEGFDARASDVTATKAEEVLDVKLELFPIGGAPSPLAQPASAPRDPPAPPPPRAERGSVVSALAAVGFGSMVLGGVSLGVSIGFGAKFFGDRSAAYDVCSPGANGTLVCPPSIERLHQTADADGAIAITTLAFGLAFVGLGTTLVLVDATKPRGKPPVAVAIGPGAVALRGVLP